TSGSTSASAVASGWKSGNVRSSAPTVGSSETVPTRNRFHERIFLLSPATCSGLRAELLTSGRARFPLAERLRSPAGAPLGEVFSFLSGLYFRGKLTYARAFARPPAALEPG